MLLDEEKFKGLCYNKAKQKLMRGGNYMKKYDLIVVGGGFAGFGAAVAAAREGLKTLLIERTNALSGAANTALVMPFMPYSTVVGHDENGEKIVKELSAGVFKEVVDKLREVGRTNEKGNRFDNEYLKLILNRMAVEAGVELLFNASVAGAVHEGNRVKSVTVVGRGQTLELEADYFIDSTGDANLIAMTGFPFRVGRDDGLCQPMTMCFRMAGVDVDGFYKIYKTEMQERYIEWQKAGKIRNPREDILPFHTLIPGVIHLNTTRVVKMDPTDMFAVTKAEIEAREQVFEMLEFFKTFECCKDAEVVSTACEIGTRESRMIEGEYVLTSEDLLSLCRFEDSIALGNYDIDIHNPEGAGTSHYFFKPGEFYEIPYRSLIPQNAENLLVAGRCISTDHEAQASIRIMPIVCTLGQAAGSAIAVAKNDNCGVKEVDIKKLQRILVDNGAAIH